MTKDTCFWVENPSILVTDLVFFPTKEMSWTEKLNALTRLAIVISIILYVMDYEGWLTFLIISLLALILFHYININNSKKEGYKTDIKDKENMNFNSAENFNYNENDETLLSDINDSYQEDNLRENFSLIPHAIGDTFHHTTVAPTFAEEHRVPPPAYDHYTNIDYTPNTFEEPMKPQAYPYGQYLTTTNMLPSDESRVHHTCSGGSRSARDYVNSVFTKHDLAFKENMTRLYKKKLNRRFRHNTQDTYSPYHSY